MFQTGGIRNSRLKPSSGGSISIDMAIAVGEDSAKKVDTLFQGGDDCDEDALGTRK